MWVKIKRLSYLLTVFILISSAILIGCEKKPTTKDKLEEFIKAYNENVNYKYNGTILVAKGDNILLNEGYGFANYEENIKNTSDSIFAIGSITKSFTAVAIMQLQEKGLLNVNDPISKYIDGYNREEEITIHQLLTHTSGLTREGKLLLASGVSLDENIEFINTTSLLYKPGENHSYSNAGYITLAAIIEKVSGKSYNEYIKENIFTTLKMDKSRVGVDKSYGENQSIGYEITTDKPKRLYIYDLSCITGSGNIYSTALDLYKYDRGIFNKKILSKESLDKIFTPHWGDFDNGYGYGWDISKKYDHKKISHGGNIAGGGYKSLMIKYPDNDYLLIFLTNNSDSTALYAVSEIMEAIIFDKEYVIPQKSKDIKIDPEILKQYAGDYNFGEGLISITYKDNKLYSTADDGNLYELLPISETKFYYDGHPLIQGEFNIDKESNEVIYKLLNKTTIFKGNKVKQ